MQGIQTYESVCSLCLRIRPLNMKMCWITAFVWLEEALHEQPTFVYWNHTMSLLKQQKQVGTSEPLKNETCIQFTCLSSSSFHSLRPYLLYPAVSLQLFPLVSPPGELCWVLVLLGSWKWHLLHMNYWLLIYSVSAVKSDTWTSSCTIDVLIYNK